MGRILLAMFALSIAVPAAAQMQTVVVPAGPGVVIAPRGQAAPRPSIAPATRAQRRIVTAEPADTLSAPTAAVAVALVGAAALAVALGGTGGSSGSGGGSATGATTRTR
ncbi:hypothetical protein [Neoroseomonas oryzicola]|uniref:Uncharacterized protein n=1 Tax=Neoroseomonas oryzicola TaxID=535904 RepID=A0A9X9WBS4_9PROT|nr:hypothetical protein [Neoroseomonas oryzicola]MBR0657784.1 hypothetical protein [Neoroseomonas oryzicola]NKE18648.1 hypothetical protein [Neoroseomonas oryzicola]